MPMITLSNSVLRFSSNLRKDTDWYDSPLSAPVRAQFAPDGATWTVAPAGFPRFDIKDIDTGRTDIAKVSLSVTLGEEAQGTFASPGTLSLKASFRLRVRAGVIVADETSLNVTLATSGPSVWSGKPISGGAMDAATGAAILVGVGTFSGGHHLHGHACAIQISTTFSPLPS